MTEAQDTPPRPELWRDNPETERVVRGYLQTILGILDGGGFQRLGQLRRLGLESEAGSAGEIEEEMYNIVLVMLECASKRYYDILSLARAGGYDLKMGLKHTLSIAEMQDETTPGKCSIDKFIKDVEAFVRGQGA